MANLKWQLDEFSQCIADAEEIMESLKQVDSVLIQSHPNINEVALALHCLAQWLDEVLDDEDDDE